MDALEDITVAMTTRTLPLLLWPFQVPLPMTPAFNSSTRSLRPHQARILNRKGCGPLLKPSSVTAGAVAAAVKDATWSASRSPSHGSRASRSRVKRGLWANAGIIWDSGGCYSKDGQESVKRVMAESTCKLGSGDFRTAPETQKEAPGGSPS